VEGSFYTRGATRRWRVTTNPDIPVVIVDMDLPSRDPEHPRITPEAEVTEALKLRIHEELVRAQLAALLSHPTRRAEETT
jgi:hypothetical protein